MSRRTRFLRQAAWLAALGLGLMALSDAQAGTTLARFPTLHGDSIVFEAHGNLWRVDRKGGRAERLTSEPGYDLMPRYSPDGKWIAFTGQYQANTDVYVIPAGGGEARRLTFHSDVVDSAPERWGPDNMVLGWTPDSKNVVFLSRRSSMNSWFGRYFTVPVEGGEEKLMPLDKGGAFSWSPDGKAIAYNRIFTNFRTWKRYTGGMHQNAWIHHFDTGADELAVDSKGADLDPMWYGKTIYVASDRGGRFNLWAMDTGSKQMRQVTHFTDYDVDWPSLGSDGIVFQQGGSLYVLDLPSEALHKLSVDVPDDGMQTNPRYVDASKYIQSSDPAGGPNFDVAPNGKRVLLQARGDLFTLPAEHGNTRDLTQSSGAKEENPTWSPDGKWIAYVTDASGEDQVAIRPSEGGAEQVLTSFKAGYFYRPTWSPDSSKLMFSDNEQRLWWLDVKSRKAVKVDQDPYFEMHDYAWSPDGKWIAYRKQRENQQPGIWLYSLDSGKSTLVSSRFDADLNPVFDPDGKYLYFLSARHENPTFSQSEFNIATLKMFGIYAATLDKDAPSPFAPRSDEGIPAKDEGSDKKDKGGAKPLHIDLDGLMRRAVALPVPADNYAGLTAVSGKLYYLTLPNFTIDGPLAGEHSTLRSFDMEKRKDKSVSDDAGAYALSADGKTLLLVNGEGKFQLQPADGDDKPKDVDTSQMQMRVEPKAEWDEMYHMAWRLERDFFVNTKMNGVDWEEIHARYAKLLPLLGHREDLNYLVGEIQGELSNSHTYVGGGDLNDDRGLIATGVLGADYGLDAKSGRWFIQKIYAGDNTRGDFASPLTEPGLGVHEGDFVLAVDGRELKAPTDIYSLFVGTRGRTVTLSVADDAAGKGRHDVTVKTLHDELNLRQDDWIQHNREVVDEASGGQIGYIYLDDMGSNGMKQFIAQFYPQVDKQGLIIDDRFNGGGFIDQILLERLRRVLAGMSSNRHQAQFTDPPVLSNSYKVCLINEYSASDGDIFPYYFRKYGLGPLIGMRTWGGVRGIRGNWPLLDNGYITVPEGTNYGLDSQWVMENHGVEPDMQVDNLPGDVVKGKDAQLDAAVKYLMEKIKAHPLKLPPVPPLLPAYPPEGHD
ncbi:MAG TPA: S41 family peptidase [Gammaproteobacteria bacterium]